MSISNTKLGLIHVAKHQLHMSDEAYRALLQNSAGVNSAKCLDGAGFEQLMDRFEALGFKSERKKRNFGHRPGMATPKQLELIVRMWKQYANEQNEKALNHWLESKFKVSNIRFMNSAVAGKAIVALKHMTARGKQKAAQA